MTRASYRWPARPASLLAALTLVGLTACLSSDKDDDDDDDDDGDDSGIVEGTGIDGGGVGGGSGTDGTGTGGSGGSGGDGSGTGGSGGSGETGSDGSGTGGTSGTGGSGTGGSGTGGGGSAASVYPTAPTAADDLQCLHDGALAIAEGYSVAWTQNGTARTDLADSNVSALYTNGGDTWSCTVDTGASTDTSAGVTVNHCYGALQFIVGNTLSAPGSGTTINNGSWTLEMWISLADINEGPILSYGRNTWYGVDISYDDGFTVYYKYGTYNTDWTTWDTGVRVTTAGWHHIAFVHDAGDWRLYKDGAYAAGTASPEGIRLEGSYGLEMAMDNAFLEDVHVTHQAKYTGNFSAPFPLARDADTVLLLHLDEGSGSTVRDSGPLEHHGTTTAFRNSSSVSCP